MADINYSISVNIDSGFLRNSVSVSNATATMSKTGMQSITLTLTTNATTINTANLSAVGLAFMRNLATHTASTAQVGIEEGGSFLSFATLRSGEPAVFRLSGGTQYKAIGTSGARLRVDITEG